MASGDTKQIQSDVSSQQTSVSTKPSQLATASSVTAGRGGEGLLYKYLLSSAAAVVAETGKQEVCYSKMKFKAYY